MRCGAGDRAAFRELYQLQSGRLHGLALRLLRQPALAADAVHDTFLQVWQNAGRFDPARGSAEAWLATLLRYRAVDILRRRDHGQEDATIPERAEEGPDALALLASSEQGTALRHCLEQLDPVQRRAVSLAFLEGRSHAELSRALAVPLGTAKSRVRRALISLRRCLDP